ncbi:MAG: hypothetical protein D6801_09880, partial [Alphaproteobacteria bacterium]
MEQGRLKDLLERARKLEDEIEVEVARHRAELGSEFEGGRVRFKAEVRRRHRAARQKWRDFLRGARLGVLLTAPVIYSLIVPLVVLDIWVSLYQWICFPAYGIARVRRRDFIAIDRHHLAYL